MHTAVENGAAKPYKNTAEMFPKRDKEEAECYDSSIFNVWANGYDRAVATADDNDEYPFAGYKKLMGYVYGVGIKSTPAAILDVGIGTGTLAARLYEKGNEITGIDFSSEMLVRARAKMPDATLIEHDFSGGLPNVLDGARFDLIISTYAFHHLPDKMKTDLIKTLLGHLAETGAIIIGDVMFLTREDLEKCKQSSGDKWDEDEYIPVITELYDELCDNCIVTYRMFSHCCGALEIKPFSGISAGMDVTLRKR